MGILRNAKFPGEARPIIIQYQAARRAISACLIDRAGANRYAAQAVAALRAKMGDPATRPLVRDDARRCIEVIEAFQASLNAFDLGGISFHPPQKDGPPLTVNGVEISVQADASAFAPARGDVRVGQLFIRCKIAQEGEAAENRRSEANSHLATIAHMHALANLGDLGTPHCPTSMVLDVPRRRAVRGPSSTVRRLQNIEAACQMIAAVWPEIRSGR